ncbi:TetR/AcrR family transcriptional regulator C-terminal domain-containing protein [Nocardia sp. NPDC003999]
MAVATTPRPPPGIADLVVAEMALPAIGGDWKAALRARSASAHEVLLRHPWATGLTGTRINVGPAMLRYIDATVGCLRAAGFSLPQADRAWNALDGHRYGFTSQELNFPRNRPHTSLRHNSSCRASHFDFGLDLILDGLERLLAASA